MWNSKSLLCFFIPAYALSFYFVFSAQHFLALWGGMELNLLTFIGLMKSAASPTLDTSVLKYFFAQAVGSVMMILGFLYLGGGLSPGGGLLSLSLFIKLGMFPFHPWFLSFVCASGGPELWAVSIPQKLLPLWALILFPPGAGMLWASVIAGGSLGLFGAFSANRYSLVLGYSSLFNTGWLVMALSNLDTFTLIFSSYGLALALVAGALPRPLSASPGPGLSWMASGGQFMALLNLGGVPPFFNLWGKVALLTTLAEKGAGGILMFIILSTGFIYIYISLGFKLMASLGSRPSRPGESGILLPLAGASALFYLF